MCVAPAHSLHVFSSRCSSRSAFHTDAHSIHDAVAAAAAAGSAAGDGANAATTVVVFHQRACMILFVASMLLSFSARCEYCASTKGCLTQQ